ncbi:antibiotic biosynthesis monooxygenase [Calothrix sp. NIES-4101]|nr:antibiotic biosynthesis monooxygenase [Calothrix sp. NIES-4101]
MTIHVVARVITLPNKIEEFKALALNLVEATRQEAGCIKYELLQNQSDATDFTFVEAWESEAVWNLHLNTPHFLDAVSQLDGLVASAPDIRSYKLLK